MMAKKTVILYNPVAPYYTLPLQYLALASVIDREKYDVRIIDARIERNARQAHDKVKELLPDAACVGVSIITGTPIKDAIAISQLTKHHAPGVPVVWGGWHPSIYPEQCTREGFADYCVSGQGEETFLELLDALEVKSGFEKIPGLAHVQNGKFHQNEARTFIDINKFPAYDYDLVPLETYFKLKGRRQLDFYSSQGCPYRCAFCADPYVYNRRWSGLRGSRMLFDVFDAVKKYRIEDVLFQDENFFANKNRVLEFSKGIGQHGMTFSWAATSRADQIAPLDDVFLKEIAKANLRKVIIGAESGSQDMLDVMKKDTLVEEAIVSAEKLSRHGIGAAFNFIVGFPEEGFENTLKTLSTIKDIKHVNPEFEFNIFFFTPFPGTELFNSIVQKGYRVPQTLAEWSDIDFITYAGYWLKEHERQYVERFKFYTKLGTERAYGAGLTRPLQSLAALRVRHNYYRFPVEKEAVNFIRHKVLQQTNWWGQSLKLLRRVFFLLAYHLYAKRKITKTDEVSFLGFTLQVQPTVFHPKLYFSSRLLSEYVSTLELKNKRVLDMGTGSGIVGLCAARNGATVLSVDINPAATQCASENVLHNGMAACVTVRASDLFLNVDTSDKFDFIIWNPPFYPHEPQKYEDHAWNAGDEYKTIARFASEAASYSAENGKLILVLTSDIDENFILDVFASYRFIPTKLRERKTVFETLSLYEFRPC